MRRRHIRKAFTLVELVIVVGIITLLLGLILPVVNKVMEQARTAVCQSNQRQIAVALNAFAKENHDVLPGSCGIVAGGPGKTPHYGVGQLTTVNDSLDQATLEQTSRSLLLVRGYLSTSKVFHCPEQDAQQAWEQAMLLSYGGGNANFQYVFNQYFVGDLACTTGAPTAATTYLPVYSSANFPNVVISGSPVRFNQLASTANARCVLITEDGLQTDNTPEVILNAMTHVQAVQAGKTFVHCTPMHGRRSYNAATDGPANVNTQGDAVVATYVDGHAERLPVDTKNYVIPSDHTGLPR